MITEHDLNAAIAECQGERNPNANTCIKLAAYYTIKSEMFKQPVNDPYKLPEPHELPYSYAPAPVAHTIDYNGDSEFADAIRGKSPEDVWPVIDELMSTVQLIQPKLYNAVMRKL